jgi:hypothetical protein
MSNQHPIIPPPELVDKWHGQWLNAWVSARNIRANQWIATNPPNGVPTKNWRRVVSGYS